jgi:hypothetical protein
MATEDSAKPGSAEHDELMAKMEQTRKEWIEEGEEDDTDRMLNDAIEMAVQQGKGWAPGEKEAYMAKILDDDYIPPIFAENQEELEKSGLAEAFSSLHYDDNPAVVMLEFKKKGTDAYLNGKRNEASNVQFYRDAVNHYYEAVGWAQKIEPLEHKEVSKEAYANIPKISMNNNKSTDEASEYAEKELNEIKSNLYNNAALCHLQLKNWGLVRDDGKKVRIEGFLCLFMRQAWTHNFLF